MTIESVGYARLAEQYKLQIRELPVVTVIDSKVNARSQHSSGNNDVLSFPYQYRPEATLAGDIQFALRYEGVNLELLYLLFQSFGRQELNGWLITQPESGYARRAGFLFEWLTGQSLEVKLSTKSRFIPVLDEELQLANTSGPRDHLQNAVVDARFAEASFRKEQNWIGKDLGFRKKVDFVPPRPEDVLALMRGLSQMAQQASNEGERMDLIALAASIAFGFVFIHPFIDGNGRLHRYLIHQILSFTGFTPKGIILPVSAVILANLDRYIEVLERFSKPLMLRTRFNPDMPNTPAEGNDGTYFRFFDATEQTAFLFWALERTVEHDLEEEVNYLLGYDRAFSALNQRFDWPKHTLDLFIRVVAQNGGRLSEAKRKSHFGLLTADEISEFETVVQQAFENASA